jgi:O-antigen ligase
MYDYFEYTHDGSVNGHSFTMRLFYLKAAACAINEKWLFGTGTGDVQDKMNECYSHSGSPLEKEWYKRPHNQFVTVMVALGLVGLGVFLISLAFPLLYLRHELDALYGLFFISAIISFLFEDTLETQSGLSFFAIFNTLFLSRAYFKKQQVLRD